MTLEFIRSYSAVSGVQYTAAKKWNVSAAIVRNGVKSFHRPNHLPLITYLLTEAWFPLSSCQSAISNGKQLLRVVFHSSCLTLLFQVGQTFFCTSDICGTKCTATGSVWFISPRWQPLLIPSVPPFKSNPKQAYKVAFISMNKRFNDISFNWMSLLRVQ